MKINYGDTELPIDIKAVEKHYGVKYIGDFCLQHSEGWWYNWPIAIFYQADPKTELGHTHYLGVYVDKGRVMLTKGDSAFNEPIIGVVADNGEVVYSRYRHDYRQSSDRSVWIDGGRDYLRTGVGVKTVKLIIDKDQLIVSKDEIECDG